MKQFFAYVNLSLMLCLVLPVAHAGVDRSNPPVPGPPPTVNISSPKSFELENGLRVFVIEHHKVPQISFNLYLNYDPILEGSKKGYIDAAGRLLKQGTTTQTKEVLDEAIDFMGANLNSYSRGISGSALKPHFKELFEIAASIILNPSLPAEELSLIRTQMLSELESGKQSPQTLAGNAMKQRLYGANHPYGEVVTEETLNAFKLEDCRAFFETYFRPNISYLALVGDITVAEAKDLVKRHLGSWQAAEVPSHSYPVNPPAGTPQVSLIHREGSVQTVLNFAHTTSLKPGQLDHFAARLASMILGGSSFRLYNNLREDKGYTYGAYASLSSDPLVGQFSASAPVRNEVTEPAAKEFIYEFKRITTEPVSADELALAKRFMAGNFIQTLEDPDTIAQFALNIALYNLPEDFYRNYLKSIEAVTTEDVLTAAKTHIQPEQIHLIAVGDQQVMSEALESFGTISHLDAFGRPANLNAFDLPKDLTADMVIEKFLAARGGREKLGTIKDLSRRGSMRVMGMMLDYSMMQAHGNKLWVRASSQDNTVFEQKFDGSSAMISQMGQNLPVTPEMSQAIKLQSYFTPELHYSALGITTELVGGERVDGEPLIKLRVVQKDGQSSIDFYHAETFMKVRRVTEIDSPMGRLSQVSEYGDFREIEGVTFSFHQVQTAGPQRMEIKTRELSLNQELDPQLFEVPSP